MKRRRTLIYPYDLECCPIVRHKELFKEYEIVALVSPRGWGMTGKDGGTADYGSKLGLVIGSDFEGNLSLCDTVLFCKSEKSLDFESILMPKILMAIEAKKNIIIGSSIKREQFDIISSKCAQNGVDFEYFGTLKKQSEFQEIPHEGEFIHTISTPVIFVMGMGERTNKFEIQLSLRENILKMGYKVSQIGSREYCKLLGFHSFPSFLYNKEISETNKIVLFNHFVKRIEMEEKPDLIIIGVPGGIMPYNNNLTNRFGVLAYEVSQAVTPDSAIFSCHYNSYPEEYFIDLKDSVLHRLGCKIDCFNISNAAFDWNNSKQFNRESYFSLESEYVDKKMQDYAAYKHPVYNVLNHKDAKKMADYIINILAEYGEAQCI